MEVTLGGNRLGSGNKQKQYLNNYERSTHNLSQKWASSMGVGMLYPCLCIPAMRGDHFSIDLRAAARTIPTEGPLFGSFKLQVDLFQVPMRLYQALLHNNPQAIGLNMPQVKLPKLELMVQSKKTATYDTESGKFSNSCLMKYLGMSGIGTIYNSVAGQKIARKINAIPMLAYYDIFKNYYANKQEDKAYYVGAGTTTIRTAFAPVGVDDDNSDPLTINQYTDPLNRFDKGVMQASGGTTSVDFTFDFDGDGLDGWTAEEISKIIYVSVWEDNVQGELFSLYELIQKFGNGSAFTIGTFQENGHLVIRYTNVGSEEVFPCLYWKDYDNVNIDSIETKAFSLKNIDDMRMDILSQHTLGTSFVIDRDSNQPFATNANYNHINLNGLVLKTYQADLYNAWINTDWIDGENGIAEITKIAVSDGGIYIDSMVLANKLYNMLNRVAISGGSYEDWQDAVYEESPSRHIESPLFIGGLSSEVVFEEIVQTTPAEGTPLGTLGGRGILLNKDAGNVDVKFDEAGFLMGIVSLTPRIYYTQGNEFYLTEFDSIDDLHKPALDGIGFQNLMAERALWTAQSIDASDNTLRPTTSIGKVPAWIEYMTAVDKAYGDFAETNGNGFMILNRNFRSKTNGDIQDATTYIDPEKYNYAFAVSTLDAQNFWVEIDFDIKARRLMSAKQIPNL